MNHTIKSTIFNRGSPTAKSTWVLDADDSEGRSRYDFMGELHTDSNPIGYEIYNPKFVWFCTNVPVNVLIEDFSAGIEYLLENVMTYCSSFNPDEFTGTIIIEPTTGSTELNVSLHCICIAQEAKSRGGG